MISDSTERSWKVIAETAKACREFNELQFKYRQLAMTLIFTAFAAMGYLWTSAENGTRMTGEKDVSAIHGQPAPSMTSPPLPRMSASESAAASAPPLAPPCAAVGCNSGSDPIHRVDWLLLIFGLVTCLATIMIWYVDCGVYHRLLQALFWEAQKFEAAILQNASQAKANTGAASPSEALTRWLDRSLNGVPFPSPAASAGAESSTEAAARPTAERGGSLPEIPPAWIVRADRPHTVPLIHTAMSDWLGKSRVAGRSISVFYILGATVAYLPLGAYTLVNLDHGVQEKLFCALAVLSMASTIACSWFLLSRVFERGVVESPAASLLGQGAWPTSSATSGG